MSDREPNPRITVHRWELRAELAGAMRQPLHVKLTDALKQADEIIDTLIAETPQEQPRRFKNANEAWLEWVRSDEGDTRLIGNAFVAGFEAAMLAKSAAPENKATT